MSFLYGQGAELGLDDHAVVMGVLDDLAGDLDVLVEGLGGGVDHDGGEAAVDAGLAGLEVGAMVQMQGNGDLGALDDSGLDQLDQVGVVGVGCDANIYKKFRIITSFRSKKTKLNAKLKN